MPISEFELIKKYFADSSIKSGCGGRTALQTNLRHVKHGIGDDGAVLHCPPGHDLIVSTDVLNENVHFYAQSSPHYIGYKSLAVNLSDLAAMGATPYWFTLNLSLPDVNEGWLQEFARGLQACADVYDICLVGGDTTRGPLSIGIQVGGYCPSGQAMLRSGAMPGDRIFISGALGQAAYINYRLNNLHDEYETEFEKYLTPAAQIPLGISLRNIANAGIDVSDGLLGDLLHITTASHCGAELYAARLPVAPILKNSSLSPHEQLELACTGGEDYVLCFTVPEVNLPQLVKTEFYKNVVEIGLITGDEKLRLLGVNDEQITFATGGYDHFKSG